MKVKFDEVSQSARRSVSQQVPKVAFFLIFLFYKNLRADQTNLAVTSVLTLCSRLRVGVPLSSQRGKKSKSREKKKKSVEIKK